jgi:threonine aldolase
MKGSTNEMYAITSPDDIRQQIEDNIMTLQGVGASKYSKSVKGAVLKWETDLMKIADCIDAWLKAQS